MCMYECYLTSLIGTEPDLQNSQRGSIITLPTSLPESVSLDGCHIKTLLLTIQICLSGTNLLVLSYTYNVNKGKHVSSHLLKHLLAIYDKFHQSLIVVMPPIHSWDRVTLAIVNKYGAPLKTC